MERLKSIKQIIWIAGVLFFLQLAIFAIMLYPWKTQIWVSLAVLVVLGVYFIRISLALTRELMEKEEKEGQK